MFIGIAKEIWFFVTESAPYILFGFFLAGLLKAFISKATVMKYAGTRGMKGVFLSSLIGVPLPLCSCSVLPMGAGIREQGASKSATMSFLISTPETGADSIAISYAMLDPVLTVARPVAAFFTAIVTGLANLIFNEDPKPADKDKNEASHSVIIDPTTPLLNRIGKGIKYSYFSLLGDLAFAMTVGLIFAGFVSYFVPDNFLAEIPGGEFVTLLAIIGIGIPLYICATSSTPFAAALMMKGLSPGFALILLLVGPATNIATISVLLRVLGKKAVAIYLTGIIISAVTLGYALNWFYAFAGIEPHVRLTAVEEFIPHWLEIASAVILCLLLIRGIYVEKFSGWLLKLSKYVHSRKA